MDLETLVANLSRDPRVIKQIEEEVKRLSVAPTIEPLERYKESRDPAVQIYMCKALEGRIKEKIGRVSLGEEIYFTETLINTMPSPKVAEIFSTLGLFCWPAEMPDFLSKTVALMRVSSVGYQVLLSFLDKINFSTSIDEKRRAELKKAIGLVANDIIGSFSEEYAEFIIKIYVELLKIIPKTFDFSIVFKYAPDYPQQAIDFILEAGSYVNPSSVIPILSSVPEDAALLGYLSETKLKNEYSLSEIFKYAIRSINNDVECFQASVEFWLKSLSGKDTSRQKAAATFIEALLPAVTKVWLGFDEITQEDVEGKVFGLFTAITKLCPRVAAQFVFCNERALPKRVSSLIINKIAKNEEGLPFIPFTTPYLRCLVAYLRNDPGTPQLAESLNLEEKDEVRLLVQILSKFSFDEEQLKAFYNKSQNKCLAANEIVAECLSRLRIHIPFNETWTMNRVIQYFYLLKKDRSSYIAYKDSFYSLFVQNAPFDRCFSIIAMIGEYPEFILQSIHEKMDSYSYVDLNCFNNDLLMLLPEKESFIRREATRFISEWNTLHSFRDYYQAMRSLLGVLESNCRSDGRREVEKEGMTDLLLELIQVDFSMMVSRVLLIFNNFRGPFNTYIAVYYLLTAYNSSNLVDVHSPICQGLAVCLIQPDGPQAFNSVAGIDLAKAITVQSQIAKIPRKNAVSILKRFLKDFRGKVIHKLFQSEMKVTKQNIFSDAPSKADEGDAPPNIDFL